MRKIGLLGGTFSPPHEGHLHAAKAAVEELGLEELWFLPAAQPPHKILPAGTPTPEQRAEMTELLAQALLTALAGTSAETLSGESAGMPAGELAGTSAGELSPKRTGEVTGKGKGVKVCVCRLELELPPPSYTARTVSLLREQYPEDEFTFIVGSDMLLTLARWYHPEIILQKVRIAALSRLDADTEKLRACANDLKARFGGDIVLLSAAVRELSSTELRELLEKLREDGDTPPAGLPETIYRYIRENGLYRNAEKDAQHG